MSSINCRGKLLDLAQPQVMGILNVTPDSFYDRSRISSEADLYEKVQTMLDQGADMIDLGGYSTRPNAGFVTQDEEIDRVVPTVKFLMANFTDLIISVDTFRSDVAARSIDAGASIINDISAGSLDGQMLNTIAKFQVPYIMMHMLGDFATMHQKHDYENIIKEMLLFFAERIQLARQLGINDLILDPGFGFSKSLDDNFQVLNQLADLSMTDLPILVGVSRKSMICRTLDVNPAEALNGTSVINTLALTKGAKILRVHDVREAKQCVALYQKMIGQ
ncbi:MAG: dihydropteroate synthase [Flavobacterium sp.]|nr:dihydropteroate synthase [Flavobacterium sp.]